MSKPKIITSNLSLAAVGWWVAAILMAIRTFTYGPPKW